MVIQSFNTFCWSAPSPWHVTWPIYGLAAPIQYYLCATPPSHVDSATISCLLDFQAMGILALKNRYPLVDLQVETSPAQSESV